MVDRETICDTAKYLRQVRPIDPEEIQEYVDEHPGVIRQVLREEAPTLGLIETDAGTFEPVDETPVAPTAGPITAVPERYTNVIRDTLIDAYGSDWAAGDSGNRLRERIRAFKDAYFRGAPVTYDRDTALGYAIYHLPDYYAAIQYVLRDLTTAGLLDRSVSVCDVGAGVGGPALGLIDSLPDDALLTYRAIEPSDAAADLLTSLLSATGPNSHSQIDRTAAETADIEGPYDLIIFANVLSELDDPVAVTERFLDALAPDGTMMLLAPADRNTTRTLRTVERALVDDGPATTFSPTLRLWPHARPTDEGWSFAVGPELDRSPLQTTLQAAAPTDEDAFVNTSVKYAYALLRTDGRRRIAVDPDPSMWARLADSEPHVGDRIDLMAVKLSADLAEGANPLFRIGDGSQSTDHFAVLAKETSLNRALREADYGTLMTIESGLVLWNDDETAYNVVVDDETVVDAVGP
ncbi:MAG: small ribosomal subunit Rsm22 family protein [Salinarchaeum sp.]